MSNLSITVLLFLGDVAKAFGGGADFVMLGGMLAGHDECGGEIVEKVMTESRR